MSSRTWFVLADSAGGGAGCTGDHWIAARRSYSAFPYTRNSRLRMRRVVGPLKIS